MSAKKTFSVFLGIFLCSVFSVSAYDNQTTHPALTSEIVQFYNLKNTNTKLSGSDKQFIIQGTKEEDTTPRWVNHFFDPVRNEGWTGEHQGDTPALATKAFTKVGIISRDPLSAVNWATNDLAQYDYDRYGGDNAWKTGLQAYATGDREKAMKILGHILHLLEDRAVPDHTRNDSHAPLKEVTGDEGSPYEDYATQWNVNSIATIGISQKINSEQIPAHSSIEEYLRSMAEYSNKYFFSKDTINDQKYENPKIINTDENYAYGIDENGKGIKVGYFDIKIVENNKIEKEATLKNRTEYTPIFDSYFSHLASKVVLNGTGVIELFFKQGEDQKINNEFPTHIIGVDRHAFRTPAFSFVSEALRVWYGIAEVAHTFTDAIDGIIGVQNKGTNETNIENIEVVEQDTQNLKTEINKEQDEDAVLVSNDFEDTDAAIEDQNGTTTEIIKPIRSEFIISTTTEDNVVSTTTSTTTTSTIAKTASSGGSFIFDAYPNVKLNITEIMYNGAGSDSGKEWVEIFNAGTSSISLKGMKFVESGKKHTLSFYSGSESIPVGEYAVISQSPDVFLDLYPNYSGSLWKSAMALSNTHDTLAIFGNIRNLGEAEYFSSYGANGDGKSLQKIQSTWYPSAPTPGIENVYSPPQENKKPIVNFSFSPGAPKERELVTLFASSTDPDGTIQKYVWKFGDGEEFTSVISTTTHTYSTVGTYLAEVDVYDSSNEFTSSTTTISIEPSGGKLADHVVISEIQYGGVNAGDEFIELYNPTTSTIDMTGWSIQYVSGRASEVTKDSVSKKNFVASTTISGEKYFLIVRGLDAGGEDGYYGSSTPDLVHRSFSMSGSSTGGLVFLVNNNEDINSVNDENIIDFINYEGFSLANNKSLERRGWNGVACASALIDGSGEFQGNGCDTEYMHSDLEIRDNPNPQNSSSMREPRDAPTIPEKRNDRTTFADYIPNENTIHFYWSNSIDSEGNKPWFELFLRESTTTTKIAHTTSTEFIYKPPYVGSDLSFELRACDRDASCSEKQLFSVNIPSYAGEVFFGKRNNKVIIELNPKQFPFIPDFNNKIQEKKLIVFLNKDAETTWQTEEFSALPGSLKVQYKGCHGYMMETNAIIFPNDRDGCVGYGPSSGDYEINYAEDGIITLTATLPDGKTEFLPTDYITFAFYSRDPYASGRYFNFITKDNKHYYFDLASNFGKQPVVHGPIRTSLLKEKSTLYIEWSNPTDSDSYDGELINEVVVSTSTATSSLSWINTSRQTSAQFLVGVEWPSYVHIRAKDIDENYSDVYTESTGIISPTILISQTDSNDYGYRSGYSTVHYTGFDEAEYQNVITSSTVTFDVVGLKTTKTSSNNSGLRLIVYPSLDTGLPDFLNPIAKTQFGDYTTVGSDAEIMFFFDMPITFWPSTSYWFGIDVPGASGGADMNWKIAIKNTDSPTIGRAGWGYGPGRAETCTPETCTYTETNQTPHEWWLKIGKRN